MTRLRCKECDSLMIGVNDVILCPNGHGRAILKQNVSGFTNVSSRVLWIDTLPLATKAGWCTTNKKHRHIYRLANSPIPYELFRVKIKTNSQPPPEIKTNSQPPPGVIFAKTEGTHISAVALVPATLHPHQLARFGFQSWTTSPSETTSVPNATCNSISSEDTPTSSSVQDVCST